MDIGVQVIVDEYKRIVSCFLYDFITVFIAQEVLCMNLWSELRNTFFSVSPTFDVPEIWIMCILAHLPTLGFNSGVKKSAYTRVYMVSVA